MKKGGLSWTGKDAQGGTQPCRVGGAKLTAQTDFVPIERATHIGVWGYSTMTEADARIFARKILRYANALRDAKKTT